MLVDVFLRSYAKKPQQIILDIDATFGTVGELERIVTRIREHWPKVKIIIRGDSGFCREDIMSWCEENKVG